jgi:hypothetical protein
MGHTETLVGLTTRPVVCVLCGKPIEIGTLAAYTRTDPEPKGSRHAECHLRRRSHRAEIAAVST